MKLSLAVAVLAFSVTAANAQLTPFVNNGNQLLDRCEQKYPSFCYGYLAGVADVAERVMLGSGGLDFEICIPERTTIRQLYDAVMKGLKDNPQDRTAPALFLALKYLRTAWPCKQN
jgi:hypothetical protein